MRGLKLGVRVPHVLSSCSHRVLWVVASPGIGLLPDDSIHHKPYIIRCWHGPCMRDVLFYPTIRGLACSFQMMMVLLNAY